MIESARLREGLDGSAALAILRRRRYTIVVPLAGGLIAGLIGYQSSSPTYVSEAVLALDVRRVQALPSDAILSPLPQDSPVLRTELDVINSRLMASSVLQKLEHRGVSFLEQRSPVYRLLPSWALDMNWMSAEAGAAETAPTLSAEVQRERIDYLLARLKVSNDGRSFTIFISFSSEDPAFSSDVANAFADAYLDHQIAVQQTAMRRVTAWLGDTLIDLRARLEASEKAAEDFRQAAGLIQMNGETLQMQSVSVLRSQLSSLRADAAATNARLETIRGLSAGSAFPAMAETLQSATIQALRIEQSRVERQLNELEQRQATKSKDLPVLSAQLKALDRQIQGEVERQIESLENEITVMDRKEASLAAELDRAQRQLTDANVAQVTLAQLEREAAANRTIYESFLVRYKQAIEQDGIAAPEARVISAAEPATSPAKPSLSSWIAFGLGLGAAAAGGGVLLREATDHRWRLRNTIETETGVPVLATLPRLSWREQLQRRAVSNPELTSAYALLRRALRRGSAQGGAHAIVVTSAVAGEGKTTIVLGLARSAAAAGLKVAVVDADMRGPSVARGLGVQPVSYLDELLSETIRPVDVVRVQASTGISYVAGRPTDLVPEVVLNSHAFRALLRELESSHDMVLIDMPAMALAPDAIEVLAQTRRVLVVVSADTQPFSVVLSAISQLDACGNPPAGVVLTRVDPDQASNVRRRREEPTVRNPTSI